MESGVGAECCEEVGEKGSVGRHGEMGGGWWGFRAWRRIRSLETSRRAWPEQI